MQFRLKTLFLLTTLAAAYFGLVFSPPLIVTLFLLTLAMLVSPAVWIAGAVYCRGGRQAFFLGGISAGALPFVLSLYYFLLMTVEVIGDFPQQGFWLADYNLELRMYLALIWPVSGIVSITAGGAAWAVRRYLAPQLPPDSLT